LMLNVSKGKVSRDGLAANQHPPATGGRSPPSGPNPTPSFISFRIALQWQTVVDEKLQSVAVTAF
jgi:hypothetical protein